MTDTRLLAYKAINEIVKGGYSNLVVKNALKTVADKQDKAFITALVYGTIERQITLDYQLKTLLKMNATPVETLNLLRMGAYQLFYMDSVPDFAACDQTVQVAKKIGVNSSFVNGVMRNLIRKGLVLPNESKGDEIEYLSIKYSFPKSLIIKWKNDYDIDTARALAQYQPKSYTSIRPNPAKTNADELGQALVKLGAKVEKGVLEDALRVSNLGAVNNIYYNGGYYTIQGEGAMLGAMAAIPQNGNRVLDVCAAPGGKSIYISQHKPDCEITSWDVHPHRVELIKANVQRMGCTNITASVQNSLEYRSEYKEAFDSVIVDAPCSGLGTVWSKPEIRHRVTPEGLLTLNGVQEKILTNASKYVSKDGILVYCTCTLSRCENEDIVLKFLQKNPDFELCAIKGIPDRLKAIQRNGMITLLPYQFETEGFFVARMRRK